MRTAFVLVAILGAALAAGLCGCAGGDGGDGVDHKEVQQTQQPLIEAARRAGGDWAKLTPDEQKMFLDRARGNEQSAKQMLGMMAGGGAPGGAGGQSKP